MSRSAREDRAVECPESVRADSVEPMTTRTAPWGPGPLDDRGPDTGVRVLPYHRLAHADPGHRWWKPLVELVIFGACYLLLTVLLGIVWFVALLGLRGEDAVDEMFLEATPLDVMDPAILALVLLSLILMIPAVLVARAAMGTRPMGLLLSVTGRLRWGFLGRASLLALAVLAVVHGTLLLLEYAVVGTLPPLRPVEGFPLVVLMIVLLVPLQSAAEELVFRGYLLQAVGSWLRRPVFAILLPVPLFTFAHFYELWGLLAVASIAVVAGYLSWRTGGLEAAIALHAANNLFAFSFGAVGWADPTGEATWVTLVVSVVPQLVFAWLVVRSARKHRLQVTRTVHPPRPAGPAAAGPARGGPAAAGTAAGWVCPGPPACPGHWAGRPPEAAPLTPSVD